MRRMGSQASSGTPESPTVHRWSTPQALPSHSYTPRLTGRSSISKANIAPGWLLTFPSRLLVTQVKLMEISKHQRPQS